MKNPIKRGYRTLSILALLFSSSGVYLASVKGNMIGLLLIFFAWGSVVALIINWLEEESKESDFFDKK